MTAGEAEERLARSRAAQAHWAGFSPSQRARALRPLRSVIAERMDDIVSVISAEVSKPAMDALAGDVMVTLEHLRYCERHAAALLRPRKRGKPWFFYSGTRFVEVREPHGVVLVCAPWNYPLQLAVVPMATALFAGNAVLLKMSERTPRTALLVRELLVAASLPRDLVQVSLENPEDAAALLAASPDFVFFTGSSARGRTVAAAASGLLIPSVMELGGKDAALVFASCNLERAVNGLTYGSFSNAGQVCMGTRRIYVESSIFDDLLCKFVDRVGALRVGLDAESDVGSVSFPDVRQRLREQVEQAIARGAKLHTPWAEGEAAIMPAVLTDVPLDAALLAEESFGPVVCVAPFEGEDQAVAMANASQFALSASVWTGDGAQGRRVALQLQCGSCAVNDVIRNAGNPHAAFGGNKASGYGRYHGAQGLNTFSRLKTIMTADGTPPGEVHWFPFRQRTFTRLRALLRLRHGASLRQRVKGLGKLWLLLALLSGAVPSARAASAVTPGSLTLDIQLPPEAHGRLAYLVFQTARGFPNDRQQALIHDFVPVARDSSEMQSVTVGALPPGRYAVSVYVDENGNGKLDKNWLGIPSEPVGASNNPRGTLGPPRFDRCVFVHGAIPQTISIVLVRCCKP